MRSGSFAQVKSILVPLDFSPVSRLVVTRAVGLAQPSRASLVLLHVVQPPAVLADYDPALPVIQTMSRAAVRQLAKWKAFVETHGLVATAVCRRGVSPAQVIAAEAEQRACDYIIIGSHGHGAFYDLLVGSTAGGVLRRVHCPVVIVPALHAARSQAQAARERVQPSAPLCDPNPIAPRHPHVAAGGPRVRPPLFGTERPMRSIANCAN
jgi:nucleotide-binding universal stress UspA family protein